jgi:putative transposase
MDKGTTNDIQGQIPQVVRALDELAREGARRMIGAALELEVEEYIEKLRHLRDENGQALVVRNGKAKPRTVSLGAGPVELQAPRINDRRSDHRFTSKILPPYMRRSPRLNDALPVLYLRGLSTGDFEEAIPALLGADAAGFSASTITRLTRVWQEEHEGWCKRPLTGKEYVYVWADGVYFGVRLVLQRDFLWYTSLQ